MRPSRQGLLRILNILRALEIQGGGNSASPRPMILKNDGHLRMERVVFASTETSTSLEGSSRMMLDEALGRQRRGTSLSIWASTEPVIPTSGRWSVNWRRPSLATSRTLERIGRVVRRADDVLDLFAGRRERLPWRCELHGCEYRDVVAVFRFHMPWQAFCE